MAIEDLAKITRRAMASAINKSARKAFTAASRSIRETYNIKAADVRKFSRIERAKTNNLNAIITIRRERFPVYAFSARQTRPGVTVKIKRKEGRKLIKGVFIAKMPSGKISVFRRKDPRFGDRIRWRHKLKSANPRKYHGLPIKLLTTVDYAKMFELHGEGPLRITFGENLARTFETDLRFFLGRQILRGSRR